MIYAFENLCFCQLLKKKSEIRRYKFENLLIAILMSRQKNCSSIAAEKSEMWRYKFENLLIAFSINRHRHLFSIVDGKSKMGRYKFENLLIAFLINKQRKIMSSKNQPECAFYKKNRPECAFSHDFYSKMMNILLVYEQSSTSDILPVTESVNSLVGQ